MNFTSFTNKNPLFLLVAACCFVFCISCSKSPTPKTSFYYWKTTFKLNDTERECLSYNEVSKLYIRYFDIAKSPSGEAYPVSQIRFVDSIPSGMEVVPVVYIKNEVMLSKALDINILADQINSLIGGINQRNGITSHELQVDCDWTLTSKDKFMNFIDSLQLHTDYEISTTIRLHQVKYAERTGIPNIKTGTLMYYNMGTISAKKDGNSIYDKKIASQYIASLAYYPLGLNLALPIFSWGIHIRHNTPQGLIAKVTRKDLDLNPNFTKVAPNMYQATEAIYWKAKYFKVGDQIKIEDVSEDDILDMQKQLKKHLPYTPNEIIYYDIDSVNLSLYEKDLFKKISNNF